MKKLVELLTKEKGKMATNEWRNNDSDILELYTMYRAKLGKLFFHTYSLSCFNNDTSALLKVINN